MSVEPKPDTFPCLSPELEDLAFYAHENLLEGTVRCSDGTEEDVNLYVLRCACAYVVGDERDAALSRLWEVYREWTSA